MNFIFNKLPENVTFLYGSINAVRKGAAELYQPGFDIGEDTAFGQRLKEFNKRIAFLRGLEVVHLKKYTALSFVKNDFEVPFHWAGIFLKYRGWKQAGRSKTGFSHSSIEQLISVLLAPLICALTVYGIFANAFTTSIGLLFLLWFVLNTQFLRYLWVQKGIVFAICAFLTTFIDLNSTSKVITTSVVFYQQLVVDSLENGLLPLG
jgi:hypothetical protein